MVNGYARKILFVDLTSRSIKEESLPEKIYRDYIGGQGLGVRILFERMKPKVDPLGSDNMIGFLVGPLTGTGIHGARYQVVAKSPVTGGWGDSNSGGSFGAGLKSAGYDGVFFSGISSRPVYMILNDGKVEIKDASNLWGRDTIETEEDIWREMGDRKFKVACIGPAGEAKSLSAVIMHDGGAAARSGLGSVMGSKRLKAFVVRGTKKIPLANPERFASLRKEYLKAIKATTDPPASILKDGGNCAFFSQMVRAGDTPIKNWSLYGEEQFPNHIKTNGDKILPYEVKKHPCLGCPIGCKGLIKIDESPYGVIETTKMEYETLGMLSADCFVDDLAAVAKANELCNRYGIDTITTGSTVAFAMECYERGVITKEHTGGIELTWGNGSALVAIVEKIGRREGFGAVLADGSKIAAERIGKDSKAWAMHVGGQDLPAHVPTATVGHAWGYVCDPTPARHTATHLKMAHDNRMPDYFYSHNFPKLDSLDVEANAPVFATCSDLERLWTSAGLCALAIWPGNLPLVEAISAVTGWDFTMAEGLKTGRRIQTLRQAFNVREGVNTTEWVVPARAAFATTGPNKGRKIDLKAMKEKGYEALGWDPKTGIPLESTLEELELKGLIDAYS